MKSSVSSPEPTYQSKWSKADLPYMKVERFSGIAFDFSIPFLVGLS
jgi:hypothetical protein